MTEVIIKGRDLTPVKVGLATPTQVNIKVGTDAPIRVTPTTARPPYKLSGMNIGPPGPPGSAYVHTQGTASAVWSVPHNMGFRPSVTVMTVGGLEVLGGEVVHLDVNTLQITFDEAFAGSARLT